MNYTWSKCGDMIDSFYTEVPTSNKSNFSVAVFKRPTTYHIEFCTGDDVLETIKLNCSPTDALTYAEERLTYHILSWF